MMDCKQVELYLYRSPQLRGCLLRNLDTSFLPPSLALGEVRTLQSRGPVAIPYRVFVHGMRGCD